MPSGLCIAEHWLQLGSGIFAALAAGAWLWASLTKAPAPPARFSNLDEMYVVVGRQSRRNALAAAFAGVAALLQFALAFMPSCWSGAPWFG